MEHKTNKELIAICKERGIKGYSGKKKNDILKLINETPAKIELVSQLQSPDILNVISDEEKVNTASKFDGIDLFELYKTELEHILTSEELDSFRKTYVCNDKDNVNEYIKIYCKLMKRRHQKNEDTSLYDSIIKDNNVKVIWGNCYEKLKKMPSESIGLMVTSPPYYNARDYSMWKNLQSYLDDMTNIIKECWRVLDNHRVIVWNVSDVVGNDNMEHVKVWGDRKIPLPAYFIKIFEECGFTFVDDIIWDKGEVQSSRHKNKPFPFFQYPMNCYEHILIFHKHRLEKDVKYPCSDCGSLNIKSNSYTSKGIRSWECCNPKCDRSETDRGKRFSLKTIMTQNSTKQIESQIPYEFSKMWRRDIHYLSPVIKINNKKENTLGHTAPFPMDIPEMAIRFFSYKGDTVLDMFGGSFTSAIVSYKLERIGIGIELRKDLFETCIKTNLENHSCLFSEL